MSCDPPPGGGPPSVTFPDDMLRTSEHFRYHAHADDAMPCDATLEGLEADFQAVVGALALSWPSGDKVEYFKFRSSQELTASGVCPFAGAACSADGTVFAADLLNEHELVHAYLAGQGHPPLFIEEGIAVALSCAVTDFSADVVGAADAVDAAALVAWSTDPAATLPLYVQAATLVRSLLARFGAPAFIDYYSQARAGSPAAVDAQFAAAFGSGIDAAIASARQGGFRGRFCSNPTACGAPALAPGGAAATVGDRCGLTTTYRALTLTSAAPIAVALKGGGSVHVYACDQTAVAPSGIAVGRNAGGGGGTLVGALGPGRYYLRHTGTPVVSAATLSVAAAAPDWFSTACGDGATGGYPFDESPNELTFAAPRATETWFARLSIPEPSPIYAAALGLDPAVSNQPIPFCASCGDLASPTDPACLFSASPDAATSLVGGFLLAVPTDAAQDDFAVTTLVRIPPRTPAP